MSERILKSDDTQTIDIKVGNVAHTKPAGLTDLKPLELLFSLGRSHRKTRLYIHIVSLSEVFGRRSFHPFFCKYCIVFLV